MLTLILIILFRNIFSKNFLLELKIRSAVLLRTIPSFIILFLVLILVPVPGFSQEQTYSIIKGKERIGTLSANCVKTDSRLIYTIRSEAITTFIFDINVNVMIDELFETGQMEHSTLIRKINGKEKINNAADKTRGGYVLKKKDNTSKVLPAKVNYTMAAMYFIEPLNRRFVYSECYQDFAAVNALGTNRYLIEFPGGNKSYYTYHNGICTEIEAHTDWAVITFRLDQTASLSTVYVTSSTKN